LLECAAHVALAALTALSWLGAGTLVLAPLGWTGGRALDALNRIGAGALAFALATFAAGWLGLLYAEAYVPLAVLAAAGGLLVCVRLLRGVRLPAGLPRWQLALAVLLGVYVLLAVVATCAPISSADALLHHAATPELFEQEHRIEETPWSWNSYQPYTVEMLITDGFLLWDSVQGAFAPLLLGLAALAAVIGAATRIGGSGVGLLAGAVLAAPFALWVATSTFVEPGLVLMIALAGWNLLDFGRRGTSGSVVLGGLFAGGAAGIKYQGALAAALLAVAAAVLLRRRVGLGTALAFAVPAAAVALPWYVKNAVLTGNPIYPFLFGGLNPEAERAAAESYGNYGHGESPLDLLLLPVRLLADADEFDRGEFASPLYLLFAPLALLPLAFRRPASVVLAAALVYVLAWFFGSQHLRFLAPLAAPLAVLSALGAVALAERGRAARLAVVTVVAGALATGLAVSLVYVGQFVPVVAGLESEREFLTEKSSYYEGIDWLNRNLPPDARVALGHLFLLHADRPAVYWSSDVLPTTAGPAESRAFFRRFGITHAEVFDWDVARKRQLGYAGARPIARLTVHAVTSRTLAEIGPPETVVVYALP
jgi:hypothetical protein